MESNTTASKCNESLTHFLEDLEHGKFYTIKVLDSWGKLESGYLQGNNKAWLGRFQECLAIDEKYFQAQYCSADVEITTKNSGYPTHLISTAYCLPDTCTADDINNALHKVLPESLKYSSVYCEKSNKPQWGAKEIIGLIVCIILAVLLTASTLFDLFETILRKRDQLEEGLISNNEPEGKGKKLLLSFSMLRNLKSLLKTDQLPGQIHCLHGMRFFSMSWVVLGHTPFFGQNSIDNAVPMGEYFLNHVGFQVVANAFFSVDSFFFLSGLLVTFLGMKELEKRSGKMNIPMAYLLRWIRLTPPYAFLILMLVSIYPMLGDGPMWQPSVGAQSKLCVDNWWTNILYINNLHAPGGQCFGWGWYLANDMQFYILTPFYLLLLYRYPLLGIAAVSFTTFASILITGVFANITNYQPITIGMAAGLKSIISALDGGNDTALLTSDVDTKQYSKYVTDLYEMPWCRIAAYTVGILTGFYLHHRKNKIKMSKLTVAIGWTLATITNVALVYGLYPQVKHGELLDNNVSAFYSSISRPLWCVGLAWVTIACVGGYGGYVNDILSWKGFIPLSRLTYCTYLIHPMVLTYLYYNTERYFTYSIFLMTIFFLGVLLLCNLLAVGVSLAVEIPTAVIVKTLTGRSPNQQRPTPTSFINENYYDTNKTGMVEGVMVDNDTKYNES